MPKINYPQQVLVDIRIEEFRASITFASLILKNLFLLNGGACVAILAFVGSQHDTMLQLAASLKVPLSFFLAGVLAAAVATLLAYLSQEGFVGVDISSTEAVDNYNQNSRPAVKLRQAAVIVSWLSLLCFAIGCILAVFKL